MTDSTDSLELG